MNLIRDLLSIRTDNKTFLVFSVSRREEINYSQVATLDEEGKNYFMPVKCSKKSGADKLSYDLHGFVPLSDYIQREMDQERYFSIISDISQIVRFCNKSNLSLDNLILEPKYMYYNTVQKKTYMLFIPVKNRQYVCDSFALCLQKLHKNAKSVVITDGNYMNLYVNALNSMIVTDKREGKNSSSPQMLARFFNDNGVCGEGHDEIEFAQDDDSPEEEIAQAEKVTEKAEETENDSLMNEMSGDEVYLTNCLGNRYDIDRLPFHIGRSKNRDMVIDQPTVSGDHAVITLENGHYFIKDLSTNGTYLNKQSNRITYAEIQDGDKIYFDRFCYNFCLCKQEEAEDGNSSRTVMVSRKRKESKTTLGKKPIAYIKKLSDNSTIDILEYPFTDPQLEGIKIYSEPVGSRAGLFIENVSCPSVEFETMNVPKGYRVEIFSGCSLVIEKVQYVFTVEN